MEADGVDQCRRALRIAEELEVRLKRQIRIRRVECQRLVHAEVALGTAHHLERPLLVVAALVPDARTPAVDAHVDSAQPPALLGVLRIVAEQIVVARLALHDLEDLAKVVAVQHRPSARPAS